MHSVPVDSLDDPRLAPYRNLKERDLAREGNRFIAESEQIVRRLLASDFPVESVLLVRKRAAEIAPLIPSTTSVYVVPDELMEHVIGFKFHSGVIACGVRKPAVKLDEAMNRLGERAIILICPEVANNENLGSLMRIAAGFGVDAMVLGEQCCDPFYRQSIRVSMGTVFKLNIIQSPNLKMDLEAMKDRWQFELAAAVLDDSAERLRLAGRAPRMGLLFGNEAQGLPSEIIACCNRKITIPMKLGTDSLNVAVAAGVFLYHFTDG
ncbi:MAG TPA: RNA methyltransferase [Tepidisphaeraceae bacterium]|nr:RNA methyltransferase [Tepidisphaeraceae bacterium]